MSKKSRWMLLLVVALLLGVLFVKIDSVQAIFNEAHALRVYMRVETEIMQKTPIGRYYESLFWKYNDELLQIMYAHPEHREKFSQAILMFVPELEALLNGEGDKAIVTSAHVEAFKSELNWFRSMASPALQSDIDRELQHISLDALVGMNMDQALNYINSSWTPNSVKFQLLVPNSNGRWAYYVHKGVYLEYPTSYSLQVSESESDYIYFMPSQKFPEQWNPCVMKVRIWNVPGSEKDANNPQSWYPSESIVWKSPFQTSQFQGIEFISSMPKYPTLDIHGYQYNKEYQIAVDIWVFVHEDPQITLASNYGQVVSQRYEYFQHMVENLRIQ